ncbi:tetratricopeptide repeat protein [Streptomyces catenulae]|uniref:Tetratricopeptide repeat protein n=1 Tax=Streptomyces catenulae TaxID=66875 RepID=A0ABV2Z8N0_9ACTN|nr:tetratricopeptide repeat protein [Streptomyces catenulae]
MSEDRLYTAAYEQGRIFQSERDIRITEHHHHGTGLAVGASPTSVRVALSAPLRTALRDREDLRAELLAAVGSGGGVHVLHGFGGCGKTAVARWLFEQVTPETVGLWVDASTSSQLRAGMLAVAADRGASSEEVRAAQEGHRAAADLVWRQLDASPEPWLLVMDNADDPDLLHGGWLRASRRGTVVVTSRQATGTVWGAVKARLHQVDVLPVAEAAQLLHDLAPGPHHHEASMILAQRLGCHPLALTLAGGFLAQQLLENWSVEEYLERLGENPVALLDRGAGVGSGAREMLSRTWQLSLDALTSRGLPESQAVLQLLSCWGDAPVPLSLLAPSVVQAAHVPKIRPERLEAALHGLLSASLVALVEIPVGNGSRPIRCVTAHGLLLETVAAGMPGELRAELATAAAHLVSRAVSDAAVTEATRRLAEPHVLVLLHRDDTAALVRGAARQVRHRYDVAGRWEDALPFAEGIVRSMDGEVNATAAADAIALGKITSESGDFAGAEPLLEEALRAATNHEAAAPLLVGDACIQLAGVYGRLGRYVEALELAHRAQEVRERLLGPTHAETAETLYVQLDNYCLNGDLDIALRLAKKLRDVVTELQGGRSEEIACRCLLMRAWVLREILSDASSVHLTEPLPSWDDVGAEAQAALQACRSYFGSAHPMTTSARTTFALVSWHLGDRDLAVAEAREVARIRSSEWGDEHPFCMEASAMLAHMLALTGAEEEAAGIAHRAYVDAQRILGPDHRITQLCADAVASARHGA